MADFGKAGTINSTINQPSVAIDLTSGEFLSYKLTVEGATPVFTFRCRHSVRLTADQVSGHPKSVYEWEWRKADNDGEDDLYTVLMSFAAATKYTLLIKRFDSAGRELETVKNVEYESTSSDDRFSASLRILDT